MALVDHSHDKVLGTHKIIANYTIVKPRVERVHFVGKSSVGSLSDFLSSKMFLQKNRGVKARMKEEEDMKRREDEREKKTY